MPGQDASLIKERIVDIIKRDGPSLPMQVAKKINLSSLFTSAFLSELFTDKELKMSHMKVGSSRLYFVSGQEPILEKFSEHLKSKEKEAFLLLKEKKFLRDNEQSPAIRVALRELKDFAIPFEKESGLIWIFFTASESEFSEPMKVILSEKKEEPTIIEKKLTEVQDSDKEKKQEIVEKRERIEKTKKQKKPKKSIPKDDNTFFNKIKSFISGKSTEIIDIKHFGKNEIILHVKENGEEKLLIAYKKKRFNESDMIKSVKKISEMNLPYKILSFGEPSKKIVDFKEAVKNLSSLERIE